VILHLPFETPSKKNSRVVNRRTGRSFPSPVYRKWHDEAALYLRTHYELRPLGDGPFSLRLEFAHGTLRRCDADNKVSSILDLLVDICVLPDDNWMVVPLITVRNSYVKNKPSVTVGIFPLTEGG